MADTSEPIGPATVVIVSGGSRGLGLAIVEDILARGAKVAAFARTVTPELAALAAAGPDRLTAAAIAGPAATAGCILSWRGGRRPAPTGWWRRRSTSPTSPPSTPFSRRRRPASAPSTPS